MISVTAVGATTHIPEVAVSRFFSGGGFSNYVRPRVLIYIVLSFADIQPFFQFSRPKFQDEVVTAYLKALPKGTFAGLFNTFVHILSIYLLEN